MQTDGPAKLMTHGRTAFQEIHYDEGAHLSPLLGTMHGRYIRESDHDEVTHPDRRGGCRSLQYRQGVAMRKQTIQYTSPIDALIAVAKRLSLYESRQRMDSEEFFDRYSRGQLSDDAVFVDWANDYRHYLHLRQNRPAPQAPARRGDRVGQTGPSGGCRGS